MAGDGEGAYTAASNYLRTPTATSGPACHFTLPPSVSDQCPCAGYQELSETQRALVEKGCFGLKPVTNETYHLQVGVESRVRFLTLPLMLRLSGCGKSFNTNYWVPLLWTCAPFRVKALLTLNILIFSRSKVTPRVRSEYKEK